MAKLSVFAGATSQSFNLFIQDSSSTVGAGLKGLAFNTTSLQCGWTFARGFPASITLASLASATVAYLSGGFVELSQSIMPGWYRFDAPNSILAAGNGRFVDLNFFGAANMAPLPVEIELTAVDNQNSINMGMTALPSSIANVPGGLPQLDANSLIDVDVKRWLAVAVQSSIAGIPIVDTRFFLGSISPATAGLVAIDWSKTASLASVKFFSATTISNVNAVSGNVNANMTSIAGAAVNTGSVQIGTNLVAISGTVNPGSGGRVGVDMNQLASVAATNILSNTTIAAIQQATSATISGAVSANVLQWNSQNVAAGINGIPIVDTRYFGGSISPAAAGYAAIDWSKTQSIASTQYLSGTTIANVAAALSASISGAVTVGSYVAAADPASLVMAYTIESGIDFLHATRYIGAAAAGVLAGASTALVSISAVGNAATKRITADVDASGNRSSIVLS